MKETFESVCFVLAVIVFVVVFPLMWLRRRRRTRNKKLAEEEAIAEERYKQSLRQPDYAGFSAHYGCQPPPPLRQLYEDAKGDLEGDFYVHLPSFPSSFFISYFMPMNKENMFVAWPETEDFLSFAADDCGNQYVVNPREADPKVYFYDHELPKPQCLDVSLSQFLALKRTKKRR